MSSNDDKKKYRNVAINTFFIQEESNEATYKKAFDALTQHVLTILPQGKLYRYRSNLNWRYSKPIIEKNNVYLCPLDKQNDPFEFAFKDDFGEIVRQVPELRQGTDATWLNSTLIAQDAWNKKRKEFNSYKSKMSIACFCEEKDNILLWAHYANCNKGFCIEYSVSDLLPNFQCFLLPVVYQESFPVLPNINELDTLSPYRVAVERISTKSKIWSYEKEWRVIRKLEITDNHCVNFPKPIAIYLGTNASKILENRLLELCVAKRISLYKMKPDEYSYSLNNEPIYCAKRSLLNNGQAKNGNP